MEEFKWDPSFSVDNDDIDTHHKKLISLFNEVASLIETDQKTPLFSTIKVISELNIYALFHFKEEEKIMKDANYPDLKAHKVLHQEFIDNVNKFKDEYMHNDPLLNYDIFNYLSDWVINHIIEEDAKYKEFL